MDVNGSARIRLKIHPGVAWGIIAVCALTLLVLFWPIVRVLGQIYALIVLFLIFRYLTPLGSWVARMPVYHRTVFLVLIGCLALGHFTFVLNPRRFFPFIPWEIFAATPANDPVTCREFLATTASGKRVRLLVEQLFPSITQFDLPPDPKALQPLALALSRIYNQHHGADPVRQVDLVMMAIHLHPIPGEIRSQPSCEFLQRYEVSLDR